MSLRAMARRVLPVPIREQFNYFRGYMPFRFRYDKVFWDTYELLNGSQWWSRKKLKEYQMSQLRKILIHAYENVPYYKRVFDERGVKPRNIQDVGDLRKLPYLTKEIVRRNFDQLIASNIPKQRLELKKTSGTTVSPLSFYFERGCTDSSQHAFLWSMWNRVGYKFKDKRVDLGLELVRTNNRWWKYNPFWRSLTLSPYHMTEEHMQEYIRKIAEYNPKVIKSIPSVILVLADFMQRHDISSFPSVEIILCGSEMLYSWQRKKIEKVFGCRIFSFYGQSENVVLAGECEQNTEYHIFPEYGVTELIGADGNQVEREGEVGEIVGTGFNNYAMPFIRYKISDIAISKKEKCICGREYSLLSRIEGREQEYMISRQGHLIPITSLPYSSIISDVKQFQFYQEEPGRVTLKVVKLFTFSEERARSIVKKLEDELPGIHFDIALVDDIPRTDRGKYRYMIQKLPIKFQEDG